MVFGIRKKEIREAKRAFKKAFKTEIKESRERRLKSERRAMKLGGFLKALDKQIEKRSKGGVPIKKVKPKRTSGLLAEDIRPPSIIKKRSLFEDLHRR